MNDNLYEMYNEGPQSLDVQKTDVDKKRPKEEGNHEMGKHR